MFNPKLSVFFALTSLLLLVLGLLFLSPQLGHTSELENRTKVAVIDSGLNVDRDIAPYICKGGLIDLTGTNTKDPHGHGTNVASIIKEGMNPERQCLISIKYWNESSPGYVNTERFVTAINIAVSKGAKFINLSSDGTEWYDQEYFSLLNAVKTAKVVIAAGNQGKNLSSSCFVYPACYKINSKNFYVVANYNKDTKKYHHTSNRGGPVNAWKNGVRVFSGGYTFTGTSQATALKTMELVYEDANK